MLQKLTAQTHPDIWPLIEEVQQQYVEMFEAQGISNIEMPDFYIKDAPHEHWIANGSSKYKDVHIQAFVIDAVRNPNSGFTPDIFKALVAHERWHIHAKHDETGSFENAVHEISRMMNGTHATEFDVPRECEAFHAMNYLGYGEATLEFSSVIKHIRESELGIMNRAPSKAHPSFEQRKKLFSNEILAQIPPTHVTFHRPEWGIFSDHSTECLIDEIKEPFKHLEPSAKAREADLRYR